MESTIAYFGLKDEDDYMYKRGAAKATSQTEARLQKEFAAQRAEAQRERDEAQKRLKLNQRFMVIQMLDIGNLTEDQIIKVFDVTAALVESVRKDLAAAPKKNSPFEREIVCRTNRATVGFADKLGGKTYLIHLNFHKTGRTFKA